MNKSSIFLIVILLATAAGVCILFAPYLPVFILAIVFGTIGEPLNAKLRRHMGRGLAAFLSTLIILLVIIGPIAFIGTALVRQAVSLSVSVVDGRELAALQSSLEARINGYVPFIHIDFVAYSRSALSWLVSHVDNAARGILATGTTLFLGAIALFYWFKDAERLAPLAIRLSPLSDTDDESIINKLLQSIRSVMRGTMTIAIIQGLIAGIGYFIFGVPNAILWGTVTMLSALIPGVGTSLTLIPVILYLFAKGDVPHAIGLTVWGALAVGLIDNLIGPRLMTHKVDIHPFFILISVLGGIQLFGPVGFLAGPLLVSLFFALLDVYSTNLRSTRTSSH